MSQFRETIESILTKRSVAMKSKTSILGLLLVAAVAFLSGRAISQDNQETQNALDAMKKMIEAHKQNNAPGEHHKKLEPLIGKWKTTTRIFMGGPNTPPLESTGEAENKWVLDGRFILSTFKGKFMGVDHEGLGLTGYDKNRNVYVGTWTDNIESHVLTMKGTVDHRTGKIFTMYGEMDEPMLKVYGRMVRYVTRIIDKDKYVFEVYDLYAGEDYRVLEVTYTRQ
jgi:hypothetical protein